MRKLTALLAVGAIVLAVAATASAMSTPKLTGTVGPGFTITLKKGGKKVKSLKAGKYTFVVSDKSNIHNFRVKGPGVNKELTSVGFVGKKTVTLKLKKGKYTYVCDPHAGNMRGSFTVK